jgi:protein phosphatase
MPLQVPIELVGKIVRCPRCRQTFTVRSSPVRTLRLGAATSPGKVRSRNEDSFLVQQLSWANQAGRHELALLAVADGMGGHAGGDRASALAIGSMARALALRLAGLVAGEEALPTAEALVEALDFVLWEAHRAIARAAADEPGCAGMGATAVVGAIFNGITAICHVGDCRAYHLRDGVLRRLTRDQTLRQRLVDLGQLSETEAQRHSSAGQVTQALGRQYDLEPSRQTLELVAGDVLLLACDGLHAQLSDAEIHDSLRRADEPDRLAQALIERADAAGGLDNCTVIVVQGG